MYLNKKEKEEIGQNILNTGYLNYRVKLSKCSKIIGKSRRLLKRIGF